MNYFDPNLLPEEERADYIAFMNQRIALPERGKSDPTRFTEMPIWERIQKWGEMAAEEARKNPQPVVERIPDRIPTGFERDVMHNRFLLGGESEFDNASLHYPQLKQTEVIRWFEDHFIPMGFRSGLLLGDTGTGKTWGALAYLNSIARPNFQGGLIVGTDAAFIKAFRLAEMFSNQKKFQDELDRLIKKRILLVDDLGAEPSGFRGADFVAYFDHMFSERHMYKRVTLITSNGTKGSIRELYGNRFVSRFNDNGSFLETVESDMRGKQDGASHTRPPDRGMEVDRVSPAQTESKERDVHDTTQKSEPLPAAKLPCVQENDVPITPN